MKSAHLLLAASLLASQAQAANLLPGPAFPQFADGAALAAACERNLKTAAAGVKAMERRAPDRHWLKAYDDLDGRIEDMGGPIYLLSNVHADPAIRAAAEKCEARWQDFNSSLEQNEKLYKAVRQLKPKDAIDQEMVKRLLRTFEDAGVSLSAAPRQRAKQINDRLTDLKLAFDKNIRDANIKLAFTEAELQGVPARVLQSAQRDEQGRIVLGMDYPSYLPVLDYAEQGATRERMWRAKNSEGGEANLRLLAEMASLRKEYAALFGYPSYADFVLRNRMAQNMARASAFLEDVKAAVAERERAEVEELRVAKSRHLGTPLDATTVQRWDYSFYAERVRRERYSVDQEAFRPYFPPQESLQFALSVIEKMMGVKHTLVSGAAAWNPEVQTYAVTDVATGKPLAALYVDLYPREGKYNHAAVWSYRHGRTLDGRAAQSALVVNLDRRGLTLEELETLLHELGHSVHNNLSATRYGQQAGTTVMRDFVEAPSQMLEAWVYDPRVMAVFQEVCAACKPVPAPMLAQAKVANEYPKGLQAARQYLYARFDLTLHDSQAPEPMALWAQLEGPTPLGHVPGSMFPAGFSHLAGGYAAGYYGYLWSLVVAMDLRTAFAADKLDPAVGRRYRNTVLANGSQRPPQDLVREFLGRETNARAFFDDLRR